MSVGECQFRNEDCRYFDRPPLKKNETGCYSDIDHIVPRRLAHTTLESLFIYSPENLQRICRQTHDEKSYRGDEPLPEEAFMRERILAQIADGTYKVSRDVRRKLAKGKI